MGVGLKSLQVNRAYKTIGGLALEGCLFYGALALYAICFTLSLTNIKLVAPGTLRFVRIALQGISLFMLAGIFAFKKNSIGEFAVLFIGLLYFLAGFCIAGGDFISYFWTLLFVFVAKDEDIETAATVFLIAQGAVFAVTAIGSRAGLIPDDVWYLYDVEYKRSLGFSHPNILGVILLSMACAFAIARQGKLKAIDLVAYSGFGFFLFRFSGARTSEVGYVALMVLLLLSHTKLKKRALLGGCIVLFVAVVVSSVAIMLFYNSDSPLLSKLNLALSQRFYYWHLYETTYPPTLFGRNFAELAIPVAELPTVSDAFITDNAYCYTILHLGVIPFLLFVFAALAVLVRAYKAGRCDAALLAFVTFLVFGFGESHTFWIGLNVALLVFARFFDARGSKVVSEKLV